MYTKEDSFNFLKERKVSLPPKKTYLEIHNYLYDFLKKHDI